MWINLLGDSNTRGVYAHFRDRVKQRVAVDGELVVGHTHTGATIGTWPGTETLVIITWMWWFPEGEDGGADMHWQETVDQLHKLTTISLQGFLKHSGLEGRLQQPDASRARALFRRVVEEDPGSVSRPTISAVSFGSHGPERTSEGMKAYLDLIFEKGVLQENVFFTTTTHVDAGKIPGRLRHQALVRNNAGEPQRTSSDDRLICDTQSYTRSIRLWSKTLALPGASLMSRASVRAWTLLLTNFCVLIRSKFVPASSSHPVPNTGRPAPFTSDLQSTKPGST